MLDIVLEALKNQVNLVIVILIFTLALVDFFLQKELKSQIVSLGVLGTFIGIFMGLQDFNPNNMKESIDTILVGLKTAFFTSITGMGVALILSIIQKLSPQNHTTSQKTDQSLLEEISSKLNLLNNDNNTQKIVESIEKFRQQSSQSNQALISILNSNFAQMNHALEVAIEALSKGATQEIIEALKEVIQQFNQELQSQFGENFVHLNQSVINLLEWQENYKSHIETLEERLNLSTQSIEKSKDSLELISSKNSAIFQVYQELQDIIYTYDKQTQKLNEDLKTYDLLSKNAQNMFSTIQGTVQTIKEEFVDLSKTVISSNEKQKNSFEKNSAELNLISNHFKNMGLEIPNALSISLEQLNRGLTTLTKQFQKDYKEIMDNYQQGMK